MLKSLESVNPEQGMLSSGWFLIDGRLDMTEELREALEAMKGQKMSPAEIDAQRISFVYGNAPKEDKGTKDTVRRSLSEMAVA
jgi:hypothetical protein